MPNRTRKARKRKAQRAPIPATVEHRAVVLAVDTARRSGWCIRAPRNSFALHEPAAGTAPQQSGVFPIDRGDTDVIVKLAEGMAADAGDLTDRDIVLVLERSWGGRGHTREGLGAARHAWEAGWRRRGLAKARIVRVYPVTWRSAVLGCTRGPMLERLELATASRLIGFEITDRDQAAAICLAEYASRAGEVGAVLPKRKSKRQRAA